MELLRSIGLTEPVVQFMLVNAILGLSIYLTLYTGMFSLANAGFMAIGAYAGVILTQQFGLPLWAGLIGGMLLAASGLLDGYQATAHWQFLSCFPQRFPQVIVAPGYPRFVHDRDRLTGAGVASGLDTALKLIELLGGRELAERAQQFTQYYPEPPVSSLIPPTPAQCPLPPARP